MGKEFLPVFDEWAITYDRTVQGGENEYSAFFENYEEILTAVAEKAQDGVLEFGVGTGNLTIKLLDRGLTVIGVDPSPAMRAQASKKLSQAVIVDGDFDRYEEPIIKINSIVSTYAFHHLTAESKKIALAKFKHTLSPDGNIVFADVLFENEAAYQQAINDAQEQQHLNVVRDLTEEYYETLASMTSIFEDSGFKATFTQKNQYVWLLEAVHA
ncbi:methyltransferase domain-containing protein [Lysinibacillus sp. FSL K6-0232]|uniref:class I SAM-dependent methyltransferase n=1 Tax=Lysinibacillus sp. FSL K6-0232 TaxID=2921425 RepID=UPI0030F6A8C7